MTYCISCGAQFPADAKFCPSCGKSGARKQPNVGRGIGYIVAVLILVLVFYAFYKVLANDNGPQRARVEQTVQPIPRTIPIVNGALTVKAEGLAYYTFTVPTNVTNIRINGHFSATGGSGNDIIVYVTDSDGLANLQNNHQAQVWYNSQKVTQSEIGAVLPNGGTYYLVFDNRFSLITPKAVQVNTTVNYIQ